MSRTIVTLPTEIAGVLPDDLTELSDAQQQTMCAGLCEILKGQHLCCNGEALAIDSVQTTITQRIQAMGTQRLVDAAMKTLAIERGADPAASDADIVTRITSSEVESLYTYHSNAARTQPDILDSVVTNDDKAGIQSEELGKSRKVRDPDWGHDLAEFVRRSQPHLIEVKTTVVAEDGTSSDLRAMVNAQVLLPTLQIDVDDNGEICCWTYEEPVI